MVVTASKAGGQIPQIEPLEQRLLLAADPVISEFMASNDKTLVDYEGDASDWVEIWNKGTDPINLGQAGAQWHLTNKSDNLTKWDFPDVILQANGYLVVFASGKNKVMANGEIHTSFKLSAGGDYLALTTAAGVKASEFNFPAQSTDVSYGVRENTTDTTVIDTGASAPVLVPTDGSLETPGSEWFLNTSGFDYTNWTYTTTGIGYETPIPVPTYLSPTATPLSPAPGLYYAPYGPNGTWNLYEVVSTTATWTDAYNTALAKTYRGVQGHLATIGSAAENAFVKTLITANSWIGLTDYEGFAGTVEAGNTSALPLPPTGTPPVDGQRGYGFIWVTGESLVYQNWASSQPSNSSGVEDAVEMQSSDGKWNDNKINDSATKKPYVVEYDLGDKFVYGPYGPGGSWNLYQLVSNTSTWQDAQAAAAATSQFGQAGHLVSITSAAENDFVRNLLGTTGWIGLTDSATYGGAEHGNTSGLPLPPAGTAPGAGQRGEGFVWANGDPFTYQNWSGGQPDNGGGGASENAVAITASGAWSDSRINDSGTKNPYVIEYDVGTRFFYAPYGASGAWNLYQVVNATSTWIDAYTAAKAQAQRGKAGHLVSITSADENNFVRSLLATNAWIGLTDSTSSTFTSLGTVESGNTSGATLPNEGVAPVAGQRGYGFKWVNSDGFTYQNWASGQPNNNGNPPGTEPGEDGVSIAAIDGTWSDDRSGETGQTGFTRNAYVIEYDLGDKFAYGPYGPSGAWNLYQLVNTSMTWIDANSAASALNVGGQQGHLVTIGGAAENAFVKSLISTNTWLGMTDSETFGGSEKGNTSALPLPTAGQVPGPGQRGEGFVWVTGQPFTWQNWSTGEPSDATPGEDAVEMYTSGLWNDAKSGEGAQTGVTKPFMVEYDLNLPALGPTFTVTQAGTTSTLVTVSNAAQLAASPSAKVSEAPFINFGDPENTASGKFSGNLAFPGDTQAGIAGSGITGDDNNFAVRATAYVKIPVSGTYTFGVKSDDGFRLKIDGADFSAPILISGTAGTAATYSDTGTNKNILEHNLNGASEALASTYLAAGEHLIELTYFEVTSGSGLELYAAPGVRTTSDGTFRLVGDVLNGGLPIRGLKDAINTDISALMQGRNTTAYVRIPFSVVDPALVDRLTLRLKYGDGFVAYLNGVEVARASAPATLAYNSAATAEQLYRLATQFVDFNISQHRTLLVGGDQMNVLAIRLLTSDPAGGAGDRDAMLDVQLVTGHLLTPAESLRFFTTPTPGAPNNQGVVSAVKDVKFSQDRGFYDAAFDLTLSTSTAGATIRYTLDGSAPTETTGIVYTGPIHITTTTAVRAAAFKTDWDPCVVETHTYIFLDDVLMQSATPAGFPTTWVDAKGASYAYPADYAMDPNIVNDPEYAAILREALQSIPTMSIVTSMEDMFGPEGIYPNANITSGNLWDVAASTEFIDPSGGPEFQINDALRIYGGVNRSPVFPKHTFRLIFKTQYGPGKLDFPLFTDPDAVQSFDTIVLRGEFNNSWPYSSSNDPAQRARAIYARDQWMRLVMEEMGDPSSHTRYVNLYINGLYWGVYTATERPDESFQSDYLGGAEDQYDVIHDAGAIAGDDKAWKEMFAILDDAGRTADQKYNDLLPYLDMSEYIDYIILNMYGANNDWRDHNFYAARCRDPQAADQRFKFFVWDGERVLEGVTENMTGQGGPSNYYPAHPYYMLQTATEFRTLFADRLQKAFFNGGALTPENAAASMRTLADQVDLALVAESARWGDFQKEPPYTHNAEYMTEMNRLYTQYFPARTANVLAQFKGLGLYPAIGNVPANGYFYAPNFSQLGGEVQPGYVLTITNPNATGGIYYTTDGSDPRATGGAVAGAHYSDTVPPTIAQSTTFKARIFDGTTWSALIEAQFYVDTPLRVTEVMYNPEAPPADSPYTTQSFEYVEVQNIGNAPLDLAGMQLTGGIDFTFPGMASNPLGIGERAVVVANPDAFTSRYGTGIRIIGTYTGSLSNGGEALHLRDALGLKILDCDFKDGWYALTDGQGYSLVAADPWQDRGLFDSKSGWRPSWQIDGNPGAADLGLNPDSVVINELVAHQDYEPPGDWVELYNTTGNAIDLGGWFLSGSDKTDHDLMKYRIPDGTILPANGYLVLTEADNFGKPFDDSLWSVGTGGLGYDLDPTVSYTPYISTNIQTAMYGVNTTLYMRIPFTSAVDPATLTALTLRMRYDDGFVAYLNGVEIARRNAPALRPWNAAATAEHPESQAIIFEDIDVSKHLDALRNGANILAIRGLNLTASDSDFLMSAQLVSGATTLVGPGTSVKYRVPTDDSMGLAWTGGQFALSELGDKLILSSPPSPSLVDPTDLAPGGYRYDETFPASDRGYFAGDVQGVAFARYIKASGAKDFVYESARTPGAANAAPLVGPVIINEIMYNPAGPAGQRDEYIELLNISDAEVKLYDPAHTSNTWKFTNGIAFAFPTGAAIPAHAYALVVGIDPALFRTRHPDVPASVTIYGPYTGVLNNAGETVELSRPGDPEPAPSTVVPYYRADQVTYGISGSWPSRANGGGSSLERVLPAYYGNEPPLWRASDTFGTPGRDNGYLDIMAPSAPTSPSAFVASESQITLSWGPSTDLESGVAYYVVYRGGVPLGSSATTSYTDWALSVGTSYTGYAVSAVNYDGGESAATALAGTFHIVALTSAVGVSTTTLKAAFNETVKRDSAQEPGNYVVTYSGGQLAVSDVVLLPDQKTVQITLAAPMTVGTAYTVTANNVVAQSGYTLAPNSWETFTYATPVPAVWREYWTGISGTTVASLTGNANYPGNPTGIDVLPTYFEGPTNWTDSYGDRVRAYVTAPSTGNYIFWIASDDNSELWMNTVDDKTPAEGGTLTKIAWVKGSTGSRDWANTNNPEQKSANIALTAGKRYYIESIHKESTGSDNLAVGWQLPNGTQERPIPASRLTPYYAAPAITLDVTAIDPSAAETGLDKGTFRLTRSGGDTTKALTVYYTLTGTARSADYSETFSGTYTFPANVLTVDLNVTPVNDTLDEPAETVILNLLPDPRLTSTTASATITIADNDLPSVSILATTPYAAEAGPVNGVYTFTRVGDTIAALVVNYVVDIASTASSSDYQALAGSVTLAIGQSAATVNLVPVSDGITESAETVVLRISTDAAYSVGSPSTATVMITDNVLPVVSIQATTPNASETGPTKGVYTLTRTGSLSGTLTVNYTVTGTAASGSDFVALPGSVTFAVGQATATVDLTPVDDAVVELAETAVLQISAGAAYVVGAPASATVTIADNDLPTVSVAATTAAASEAGPTKGVYTFARVGGTSFPLTVAYTILPTSTASAADYQPLAGTVTFAAGQDTATVDLIPVDDTIDEPAETVNLAIITNPTYRIVMPSAATVTIADNDLPTVTVQALANASEAGPTKGLFRFTRDGDLFGPLMVNYAVAAGSTASPADYLPLAGSVTFLAGQRVMTVDLNAVDDTLDQPLQTLALQVSPNPAAYKVGTQLLATATIADNDLPTVSIAATTPGASETGPTKGVYTFTRVGDTSVALTVNCTLTGTATSGADFAALPGSVTFAIGQDTVTIDLLPVDDALVEGAETVILTIDPSPAEYLIATASATVTIADNDLNTVSVVATTASASETGPTKGVFTFTRVGGTSIPLTVAYTLTGTATSGSDFAALPGSVTFAIGQDTVTIDLLPVDDTVDEPTETVILSISADASNYLLGSPSSATVSIADNDLPTVSVAATTPDASEAGPTKGIYTFTRAGDLTAALTVQYVVTGGTAVPADYQPLAGSVSFVTGQATATVDLVPVDDTIDEPTETVILSISADPANYLIGSPSSATVSIADNDLPTVSVAATTPDASEAGPTKGVYTFTRVGDLTAALTVQYAVTGGTAVPADYQPLAGSVSFVTGQDTVTVDLVPVDDTIDEPTETVILSISADAANYLIGSPSSATVSIADNDLPTVSVAATTPDASEAGPTKGVYTFTRVGDLTAALTVQYAITGGTAVPADYQPLAGSVTFGIGQDTATVDLVPVDDTIPESTETVILSISADAANYIIGVPSSATVRIADNDLAVQAGLVVDLRTASGGTSVVVTPGMVNTDITLYVWANVTGANASPDEKLVYAYYSLKSSASGGALAGGTGVGVTARSIPDTQFAAAGYQLGTMADLTSPVDSITDLGSNAASPGTAYAKPFASPTAPPVGGGTNGGEAVTNGWRWKVEQVTFHIGNVILGSGSTTMAVVLPTNMGGAIKGANWYEDGGAMKTPVNGSYTAGTSVTFTLQPTAASAEAGGPYDVSFGTDGTQVTQLYGSGAVTAGFGTVSEKKWDLDGNGTFETPQTGDSLDVTYNMLKAVGYENDQPKTATFRVVTNDGKVATDTATITLVRLATVSVAATTPDASETGPTKGVYTFTRAGDTSVALTVGYTLTGTATPTADYASLPGSVTFAIGQDIVTVDLVPVDDTIDEPTETVILSISADPANYLLGSPSSATVSIADNDLPTVSVAATTPNASEAGPTKGVYTFTRVGDLTAALTVQYAITGGTAVPADYQPPAGSVSFVTGQDTVTVDLVPVDDTIDEPTETVILSISADAANYLLGSPSSATVSIADNDLPTVSVAATDPYASEAGLEKGTYTFTRVGDLAVPLTVNYAVVGGTAVPADYQPLAGSVTFEVGQDTATVDLVPVDNGVTEPDKTVVLAVSTDPNYAVAGTPATVTINEFPVVTGVRLNNRAGRGPGSVDPSGLGVKTVAIDFSEAVTFAQGDVTVQAVAFPAGSEQVTKTVTTAVVSGSGTATMTITLPFGEAMDTWVRVRLSGSAIADLTGYRLDGDPRGGDLYIVDAATDLPTGDGTEGGDAVFYVGSLRGDMDLDKQVTVADKAAFMTKWQAKDLDADFRGVGFGVRPPDGKVMLGDMDGFTSLYLAANAAGRSLATLPAGHPLAMEVTPLPVLAGPTGGVDILAEAAGKLPLTPILPGSGARLAATSSGGMTVGGGTASSDDPAGDPLKVRQAYATDDGTGAVLRI